MLASTLLISALAAGVSAAPVFPDLGAGLAAVPGGPDILSDYFNLLAQAVQTSRQLGAAPTCDLSKAVLPTVPSGLPPVGAGLALKHVAVGRGVQNYTCDLTNTTAPPQAAGAVATLFNASCVASTNPQLLHVVPRMALQFNLTDAQAPPRIGAANMAISGHHFFTNTTTPFFNLDVPGGLQIGELPSAKNNSVAAPADAPRGQQGEPAVAWLKLLARQGATGGLQEVYRVETAGGSPPATCAGMPAAFSVQYSAEYWFYYKA
jgi:hypothetical protein